MKNTKFIFYCSILFSLMLNAACYEPIANTSGGTDTETSGVNNNENVSTSEGAENTGDGKNLNNEGSSTTDAMKGSEKMDNAPTTFAEGFSGNLSQNLKRSGLSISGIYDASNAVESRIFEEYGSVFLTKAMPPSKVMFTSEQEVSAFQSKAGTESAKIGSSNVELQPAALKALQDAVAEAKASGLTITPRDKKSNTDSAKRSYAQTLELWNGRVSKACEHWRGKKRLTSEQIASLKAMPIKQQVQEVLELEKKGIYFNTFFNGEILQSVAAPGTSQHISMLAFDAEEFDKQKVREILAKHGWFRTVQNDEPHFTYLGYQESDLPKLGLKKISKKGGEFWVPKI